MVDSPQEVLQGTSVIPLRCSTPQQARPQSSSNKNDSPAYSDRLRSTTNRDMSDRTKFSFPIPKRRSLSWVSNAPGVRPFTPDQIAEMSEAKSSRRSSRALKADGPPLSPSRDQLRFMTISIAESDRDSGLWDQDSVTTEDVATADSMRRSLQPSIELHHRPSSTILGRETAEARNTAETSEISATRQVPRAGSSTTLRSFYDPKRSPLAISQQTSASSSRDLALRKGCSEMAEPLMEEEFVFPEPPRLSEHPEIQKRLSELEREGSKALQLDLTKLFPTPQKAHGPLLSPARLTHSPSSLSIVSEKASTLDQEEHAHQQTRSQSVSPAVSVPTARVTIEERDVDASPEPSPIAGSVISGASRLSQHSARPMSWVELEEEVDLMNLVLQHDEMMAGSPRLLSKATSLRSSGSRRQSTQSINSAQHSVTSSGRLSVASRHSSRLSEQKRSVQAWADRNFVSDQATLRPRARRASRQSAESVFLGSNLNEQSILAISSSDEEDSSDDASTAHTSLTTLGDDDYEAKASIQQSRRSHKSSGSRQSAAGQAMQPPKLRVVDIPSRTTVASNQSQSSPVDAVAGSSPSASRGQRRPRPAQLAVQDAAKGAGSRTSWLEIQSPPSRSATGVRGIMRNPPHQYRPLASALAPTPEEGPRIQLPARGNFEKIQSILGPDAPRPSNLQRLQSSTSSLRAPPFAESARRKSNDSSNLRVSFEIDSAPVHPSPRQTGSSSAETQYAASSIPAHRAARPPSPTRVVPFSTYSRVPHSRASRSPTSPFEHYGPSTASSGAFRRHDGVAEDQTRPTALRSAISGRQRSPMTNGGTVGIAV